MSFSQVMLFTQRTIAATAVAMAARASRPDTQPWKREVPNTDSQTLSVAVRAVGVPASNHLLFPSSLAQETFPTPPGKIPDIGTQRGEDTKWGRTPETEAGTENKVGTVGARLTERVLRRFSWTVAPAPAAIAWERKSQQRPPHYCPEMIPDITLLPTVPTTASAQHEPRDRQRDLAQAPGSTRWPPLPSLVLKDMQSRRVLLIPSVNFLLAKGIWTLGHWSLPPNPRPRPKGTLSWPITTCLLLPYSPHTLPRRHSLRTSAPSRARSTEALLRHSSVPPAISGSPARQGQRSDPFPQAHTPKASHTVPIWCLPLLFFCLDLSTAMILEHSVPLTPMKQHGLVLPNPYDMPGFCPSLFFPKCHLWSSHLMVLPWGPHHPGESHHPVQDGLPRRPSRKEGGWLTAYGGQLLQVPSSFTKGTIFGNGHSTGGEASTHLTGNSCGG